ncbi:FAD-dependent oxidoreductase [soil metagenome]
MRRSIFLPILFLFLKSVPLHSAEADIIVYGGTSGAVVAALAARQAGKSVIMVSPDQHLGGLTSGGLGWTDLGKDTILGGLSREFYHRVWLHYKQPSAWFTGEVPAKVSGQNGPGMDSANQIMTVFEPKVAEQIFTDWLKESGIAVEHGRLDLMKDVEKDGAKITAFRTEDGREFRGKVFIDATYEGDLMARAGVPYTLGREPSSRYGESINGLQIARAVKNQLPPKVDPYVKKGDPASGLLPGVNPTPAVPDGAGDDLIQAYCYRMCLTDDPANRISVEKPAGYREEDYEILFRAIEAGQKGTFFKLSPMPNHKTDSNNDGGISTDLIGGSQHYPEGGYAQREAIARAHEMWQRGLLWTLQNHPRVPEAIRKAYAKWGLPKDEFTDNAHWSPALYVREARRMVGDYVLTQPILDKAKPSARPVALGAYAMDSHNVQRIVGADGFLHDEGDVQKPIAKPYQIDYGVLLPRREKCENLLVPFCISASHAAFGSVRMEPVFMVLSESAAAAASLAIDHGIPVQDVPYPELQQKLIAAKQCLNP